MEKQLLVQHFEEICQLFPMKIAIEVDGYLVTYQHLLLCVTDWVKQLTELGIQSGERVMLVTDHRYEFPSVFLALWQMGCVPIPLEPTMTSIELARAAHASHAHWLLSTNLEHNSTVLDVNMERVENMLQPLWIVARFSTYHSELSAPNIAFFIYTSGTTGTPKCVVYDHAAVLAIINSLVDAYQLSYSDIILTPLSPALSATLITGILPSLMTGSTLILPSEPVPGRVLKQISSSGTTIFFAVPYFYDLLVKAMKLRKDTTWEKVRLCLSTSAYLPGDIFTSFYGLTQLPIRSIYCTSEANQCTFNEGNNLSLLRTSVGKPQVGVKLRVVNEAGREVPAGEEGQIIASGTHLSMGYFHRPELEKNVYRDGWVYTGDLGYIDNQGCLYLTGRLSNTINIAGHLVNPQEVEQVLLTHIAVVEGLVLGEGDQLIGESVVGWVVVHREANVTIEELIEHCRERLIHYKVPSRIEVVHDLPKGRYGKIRRLVPVNHII